MRILVLSALYPPYAFGGAEDCAQSFSTWAATHGHEVRVLMAARETSEDGQLCNEEGVEVVKLATPHIYPVGRFDEAKAWQKPIWHLQDHFSGEVGRKIAAQVDDFAPDVIVIHYIQGFGYRTLAHLARCKVPVAFVLHDLGLACIRMSMFRAGRACERQCVACSLSGGYKSNLIDKLARHAPIGFIAPSQAIINELDRFVPVKQYPNARILNTKGYPEARKLHLPDQRLRLLYVGKLDRTKGIDVLFEAIARLAASQPLTFTIAGKGPLSDVLREQYGKAAWTRFLGFVSQDELANEMADADLLCVPSLWKENSPGVVIQALSTGLPVMATNRGGLPELVKEGVNGFLLQSGSEAEWHARLTEIAENPARLLQLRKQVFADRSRFNIDVIGQETIAFLQDLSVGHRGLHHMRRARTTKFE